MIDFIITPDNKDRDARASHPLVVQLTKFGFHKALYDNEPYQVTQCLFSQSFSVSGNCLMYLYNGKWKFVNLRIMSFDDGYFTTEINEKCNLYESSFMCAIITRFVEAANDVQRTGKANFSTDEMVKGLRLSNVDVSDYKFTVDYVTHGIIVYHRVRNDGSTLWKEIDVEHFLYHILKQVRNNDVR